jgi:hypothetical protein
MRFGAVSVPFRLRTDLRLAPQIRLSESAMLGTAQGRSSSLVGNFLLLNQTCADSIRHAMHRT